MTTGKKKLEEPIGPGINSEYVRSWQILHNNDLALVPGVRLGRFCSALTQLVQEVTVLALSLEPRGARARKIEQLSKAHEAYVRLAKELRAEGFYPPMPPLALRKDIERWIADTRGMIDNPSEDHSRRGPLYHFYPRITGLFYAAFDEEPTSWCGDDGKGSSLVEFAYHAISFARETVDLSVLAGASRGEAAALATPWQERSTAAIHDQLKRVLVLGSDPETGHIDPRSPDWVTYYGYFYDLLRS